jgi:hypothetical protein
MSSSISNVPDNVTTQNDIISEQGRKRFEEFRRCLAEHQEKERAGHQGHIAGLAPAFADAWATMANLGVVSITVSFSGEGDSGQIDDVGLFCVAMPAKGHRQEAWQKNREALAALPDDSQDHLKELVESLSDSVLQDGNVPDWYNNDGGNGSLIWTLATKTIEVEVNQKVVEYETTTLTYDANGIEVG